MILPVVMSLIAHEVGHHVQKLLGIEPKVRQLQQNASQTEWVNRLSVRSGATGGLFLLSAWGHSMQQQGVLEAAIWKRRLTPHRLSATIATANSRGVVPDSFTHGTSEQRYSWFGVDLTAAGLAQCNTPKT